MKSFWASARLSAADGPEQLPPLARFLERQREYCGLSKTGVAERIGIDRRTYYDWLNDPSKLNSERLEKLVEALKMSPENRAVLYDLSGRAMPPRETSASALTPMEVKLQQVMADGFSHPALVQTQHWDVLFTNAPFRKLFASVPRYGNAVPTRNPMLYILVHPAAKELLGGSEEALYRDWVMPSLATFSAALQQAPQDVRLLEIEEEIKRRKRLLRAYRETPDWIREHSDLHVNSDPRAFVHPELGETTVRLVTEAHLGYQSVQLFRSAFLFGVDD
ncbi:helix-turn-helix domain-containing protein [Streptomyces xantholiticus]|uniref:Helix-turn-helix domain-containing protein n=1 Tax=Streptomyces xantholiticus TaxID=68285 RepID=A0ABV1V0A4_9ACTN